MNDAVKAWIETSTGRRFHILNPSAEEIDIRDIGHGLSMMCRFTGQVRRFYSVAEHCVHCSRLVKPEFALQALMHDASEAYIADINRPMKHFTPIGDSYKKIEKRIMDLIYTKFGMPTEEPKEVKDADTAMLLAEKSQLMTALLWDTNWAGGITSADTQVRCWSPEIAETVFLYRFYELTNQL